MSKHQAKVSTFSAFAGQFFTSKGYSTEDTLVPPTTWLLGMNAGNMIGSNYPDHLAYRVVESLLEPRGAQYVETILNLSRGASHPPPPPLPSPLAFIS